MFLCGYFAFPDKSNIPVGFPPCGERAKKGGRVATFLKRYRQVAKSQLLRCLYYSMYFPDFFSASTKAFQPASIFLKAAC